MQCLIEVFKNDLVKICMGCVYIGLFDYVQVDYYGLMVLILQVVNLMFVDVCMIGVQLWEKNMVVKVEKVICEVDLGLNLVMVGDLICVLMFVLMEECCCELIKVVKSEGEMVKVVICNLCCDVNEVLKKFVKDKEILEDDECCVSDDVQKLIDKYVVEVDKFVQIKEVEIMMV